MEEEEMSTSKSPPSSPLATQQHINNPHHYSPYNSNSGGGDDGGGNNGISSNGGNFGNFADKGDTGAKSGYHNNNDNGTGNGNGQLLSGPDVECGTTTITFGGQQLQQQDLPPMSSSQSVGSMASTQKPQLLCLDCNSTMGNVDELCQHLATVHYAYRCHTCHQCDFFHIDCVEMGRHAEETQHSVTTFVLAFNEPLELALAKRMQECMDALEQRCMRYQRPNEEKRERPAVAAPTMVGKELERRQQELGKRNEKGGGSEKDSKNNNSGGGYSGGIVPAVGMRSAGSSGGKVGASRKKYEKNPSHICHFPGCGHYLRIRAGLRGGNLKKRHILAAHFPPHRVLPCPVRGCKHRYGSEGYAGMDNFRRHIRHAHGGVEVLAAPQLALYEKVKREEKATMEQLINTCFPRDGRSAPIAAGGSGGGGANYYNYPSGVVPTTSTAASATTAGYCDYA